MPGVFDEILAGGASPSNNLTPEQLQAILAYRDDPRFSMPTTNVGGISYWYDPSKTYDAATDTHGFMLTREHGWRRVGEGDASSEIADPTQDRDVILRLRAGTGGKLGDRWDTLGNYLGTYEAQDGGGRGFNQAALMIGGAVLGGYTGNGGASGATAGSQYGGAAAEILGADIAGYTAGMGSGTGATAGVTAGATAGGQYGGAAAEILGADAAGYTAGMGSGTGATATTFTANDIAMMSANGMTDAQIATTVGANNASAVGLAGPGTGVTFADTVALANTQVPVTGLQDIPVTTQPGPNATNVPNTPVTDLGTIPPTTTTPTTAPTGWDKFVKGLKDAKMLGLGADQIIALGLAAGLKRDVKPGEMDPALVTALENYNKIAGDANDRAQANDDYWKSTFAPKLLDQMDQQMADGRRLTDFNMGQAQKYADYQWNTIVPQQRKFFDYGNKLLGEDTSANVERQVGLAGATARQANDSYISAAMNNLARMGVNPNSGVYASQARQFAQTGALAEAGERNRARQMALAAAKAEKLNVAGVMAGMGGNLSAASSGFSGQAANSSGLGMNGVQGAQQGWANNNAGWNATMGLGMNANAGIAGIGNTMFGAVNQANRDNALGYNQLAGTLLAYGLNGVGRGK